VRLSGLVVLSLAMALALGGLPSLASESGSDPAESNHTTAGPLQDMLERERTAYVSDYPNLPGGVAL
jgi:hypothetical protein